MCLPICPGFSKEGNFVGGGKFFLFRRFGRFCGGRFGPVWGGIRDHRAFVGGGHPIFVGGDTENKEKWAFFMPFFSVCGGGIPPIPPTLENPELSGKDQFWAILSIYTGDLSSSH